MILSVVLPQYGAGLAAAMGAFAAGTLLGWSSPVQLEITKGDYGFPVSEDEFSWIGSLVTLGATFVCIPIGFLINILGRKLTMLLLVIPFLVGWALLIWAQNPWMMMAARFLLGISGGAFCVTAPMYTTEIAQIELRGALGSFFQLLLVCGVLFSYCLGAVVKAFTLNCICGCLPIVFLVIFIFMPESPVYLTSKGAMEKVEKSLRFLRGKDYDVKTEIEDLKAADKKLKDNPVSIWAALKRPMTLKALGISIMLMIFQQLSGINAIIFYSSKIFEAADSGLSPAVVTILIGAIMVVFTLISVLIIDKVGRRILLIISSAFMALSTCAMGVYFYMKENNADSVKSLGWLPVAGVLLFIIAFSIGYGPVPWLLIAELFAGDAKSVAGSISGTTNWLMAFVVTVSYNAVQDAIGAGLTFLIFTIISILGLIFVLFLLPETKGRSLAEIQEQLEGNPKPMASN